ncbi:MAG TPA: serine hydrolase domain-containing protein [Herpetosiphonaceae bacterium]|nr:serine hydrolase domain-containing protein [Herpetosiphonaceae bacterium]
MNLRTSIRSDRRGDARRLATPAFLTMVALLALLLAQATTAAGRAPRAAVPDLAAIDAFIEAQMRALRIPGLALGIVHGDQIVQLTGYGVADPPGRPVTPQTPFRLASVSKPITALAVLQLAEQGKIDLDAPVQRYLPWFQVADPRASQSITVRHLLHHTSGLPASTLNDQYFNGDLSAAALERNVRRLAAIAPNRPVGSSYEYTDLNYGILGLIVQTVAGQSYDAYIEEHIFGPLAMRQSFTTQVQAAQHGLATGYRQWFGRPVAATLPDDRANIPSSSLIASAEDMTHLLIALLNGGRYNTATLLSSGGIAAMLQPHVAIGTSGPQSAMGFVVETIADVHIIAKTGGTANYNARIVLVPDQRWGVVVLANTFDIGRMEAFDAVADGVALLLAGKRPAPPVTALVGGFAPMKWVLLAIVGWELVQIARVVRRGQRQPAALASESRKRWPGWQVVLRLVLGVGVAVLMLGLLPQVLRVPLQFLRFFVPDLFWLTVAAAMLPLAENIIRTMLTLRGMRQPHLVGQYATHGIEH